MAAGALAVLFITGNTKEDGAKDTKAQKVQLPAELALSFSFPRSPINISTYLLMARIYLHLAAFIDYENMMFSRCIRVEIMYRVRALKF